MRGVSGLAAAGCLAVLLAGCATVEIREPRVVRGQVTDEAGRPVAGTPVVVVGRSLDLNPRQLKYTERDRQDVQGVTDREGRYRLAFVPASLGNNFFLFFHGETGFDRVRYQRPEPLDITALLRRGGELTVNQVLRAHPAWPEVERQLAFYGPTSERGRILRKHGLPEKREVSRSGDAEIEVWWYYADGVSYWFTGGVLTRTHPFQPIPGAAPAP